MNEFVAEQILKQNRQMEKMFAEIEKFNVNMELNCVHILKHLRTLVEHIVTYHYGMTESKEYRVSKETLRKIISFMKKPANDVPFLAKLHKYLQAVASHYVIDEVSAPRLLSKYMPYLYETKKWVLRKYKLSILSNMDIFLNMQTSGMSNYYVIINNKISQHKNHEFKETRERYYVFKSIPRIVQEEIFYVTTVGIASNFASKFNRFIVFSRFKIDDRYAIKLNIEEDYIEINKNKIPIKIATAYTISIRPCELINYAKLLGINANVQSNHNEYLALMKYMTRTEMGLHNIILSSDEDFEKIGEDILKRTEKPQIWPILSATRSAISSNMHGKNVLGYLLVNMNNKEIKDQKSLVPNQYNLYIKPQPFDSYPLAMSLCKHNTSIFTLMEFFPLEGNEDQLFYRKVRNLTNEKGILYHSYEDLFLSEEEADIHMKKINDKLSWDQKSRINNTGKYYFIQQYEDSSKNIVDRLMVLSNQGAQGYPNFIRNQLAITKYGIDSEEKKSIILKLFESSRVACIYGPAGTGKSTLAKHISNLLSDVSKKFISNTHPAVMNMYRKIGGKKEDFLTVKSYLREKPSCDILFIDECSMVSNHDMDDILRLSNFKNIVLLGDTSQIQSIEYGTWFKLIKAFLMRNCVFELTELHRTSLPELTSLWKMVRNREDLIDEILSDNGYVRELDDEQLFQCNEKQIILCLTYDGLYGINNLNLILQEKNTGDMFEIGPYKYRINDPVLFTENNRFSKILYNNLKGRIKDAKIYEKHVKVFLNVETSINSLAIDEIELEGLQLIRVNEDNTSDISILVDCHFDSDNDEYISKLVPFQLAYAVSIHKAQGLEYETVKIVISEDLDERLSHDVFYTAITRATKKLEIYWTTRTQKKVLNNILKKEGPQDIQIFSRKFGYKIRGES